MPVMKTPLHTKTASWKTPSAEEYAQFRPLLFRALALLSRQGYGADADEGIEIIHDFFLEAWPGLRERHDAAKAAFSTYVFAAFVRFARPRIVRMQRWNERLLRLDPSELESLPAVKDEAFDALEKESVRNAFRSLSSEDRALLNTWVHSAPSERRIATKLGMSRYQFRRQLVAALARLAARMGERVGSSENDWRVAKALWDEQRTVADTAAALGMSTTQVRLARQRVFEILAYSIARNDRQSSQEEQDHVG